MIPITLSVIIWRWIFNNQYGIANHLIVGTDHQPPPSGSGGLDLLDAVHDQRLDVLPVRADLDPGPPPDDPAELYDAAKVDGRGRAVPPHHAAADPDGAVHRHPAALGLDVHQVRHRLDVGRAVVRRPGRARPILPMYTYHRSSGCSRRARARRWRTSCSSCCCSRRTSTSATSSTTRRRYDRAGGDAGSGRRRPTGARARKIAYQVMIYGGALLLTAYCVVPLVWMLLTSLKPPPEVITYRRRSCRRSRPSATSGLCSKSR